MDLGRLRVGDWLTGAWGLALAGALWLDWFTAAGVPTTGWDAFGVVDMLAAITGIFGVATLFVALTHDSPARPVAFAVIALALASLTVVAIGYRVVIDEPGPNAAVEVAGGAYIGLICALGLFASALAAVRDESSPHQGSAAPAELPAPPVS